MRFFLFLAGLVLCGCGGGGGGSGSSVPFYGGVYDVHFEKTKDECGLGLPAILDTVLTVNQDDAKIVVDTPTESTYVGTADSEGFNASKSVPFDCGSHGGSTTTTFDYVAGDGVGDATILSIESQCLPLVCEVTYIGDATKRR